MFRDRREAGRVLARSLTAYQGRPDVVVLALARGGVPVGWEVAAHLGAPLDVFMVRKLGVPRWPELAMGAIASGGVVVVNDEVVDRLHVSPAEMDAAVDRETAELHRREATYRADGERVDPGGKVAILVDDGIATGASMKVAVQALRARGPARVVVAVPVGSRSACRELAAETDDLWCLLMPDRFDAVGQVYDDFHQVDDGEVMHALSVPTTPG